MTPTWRISRNPHSKLHPWRWTCTAHTRQGVVDVPCPAHGIATNQTDAETKARHHATTHGDTQ